jgi:hypothetical protein
LSRAKRKVEERMERTTSAHFQPEMSRGGFSSAGGGCCFSASTSVREALEEIASCSGLGTEREFPVSTPFSDSAAVTEPLSSPWFMGLRLPFSDILGSCSGGLELIVC